jgi:nicotinate-nucleotide adenylyltransferase
MTTRRPPQEASPLAAEADPSPEIQYLVEPERRMSDLSSEKPDGAKRFSTRGNWHMRPRVGIMGGTFDPIHNGHLVAASEVAWVYDLDEVIFVPTGRPVFKLDKQVTNAEDRYLMTVIATASNPKFTVSRVDIDRPGVTYTIDTLRDLRSQHPDAELFFITGADAVAEIMEWKDAEQMWDLAHFVAVTRPGYSSPQGVRLPDGTSATRYPWNGEEVLVRDDALTIIRVIEVLTDEGKSDDQRRDEFLALFFVDWADAWCACDYDAAEFVRMRDAAVWDMCGLDLTGDRPHETPLWDLEEDAARIRTSFRQAYGIEWDEVRGRISFAEFVALVGGCPQDTPLGAAIHYRNPATKPKPTKYNRQEVEAWNAAHKAFELGKGRSSHGSKEGSDAAMRDVFAALKRATR